MGNGVTIIVGAGENEIEETGIREIPNFAL